jgi:sulfite dehydrogenase (cytochrome) subunit B
MRRTAMFRIIIGIGLVLAIPAFAEVKPGTGQDTVEANCGACHTTDYIRMNAPFLTPDAWKAEVTKMRAAFGSPIDDAVAAEIVRYLTTEYGPKK